MATVNGTLISMFRSGAIDTGFVDIGAVNFRAASAFSWTSGEGIAITLHSGLENIAYSSMTNLPVAGTINDITAAGAAMAFTITGLSRPVTSLFSAVDAAANHVKFWESSLLGTTTFNSVSNTAILRFSGDFVEAGQAQNRTGAADVFNISLANAGAIVDVYGDALSVALGGRLTGGADVMRIANTALHAPVIIGDARFNNGTLNGGDDRITVTCPIDISTVVAGDAFDNDGVLNGGDDRIVVAVSQVNGNAGFNFITGDAYGSTNELNGGNDIMTLRFTGAGPASLLTFFVGDVDRVEGVNSLVRGGADTMAIINAGASVIAGDANLLDGGHVIGGNDRISGAVNTGGVSISGDVAQFQSGLVTGGNDVITGSAFNDLLYGEFGFAGFGFASNGGNDAINAGDGNDLLFGQSGNDQLIGGRGNDRIDGDTGIDTARYDLLAEGVHVDLEGILGAAFVNAIGQGNDELIGIENVRGSSQADRIKGDFANNSFLGNAGDDILFGRDGSDTLNGGAGNDHIFGGMDRDTLTGGAGVDTFHFRDVLETTAAAATADRITGWAAGDRINLAVIDANGAGAGNTAFAFQAGALTGAGQLRAFQSGGNTIVEASIDGDAAAEFVVVLTGLHAITGASFVL